MTSFITGNRAFPKFSVLHTHCAMTVKFNPQSCLQVFDRMKDVTETSEAEPKTAGGLYALWDATEEEELWVTRTKKAMIGHNKYDVMFDYFNSNEENFQVDGCTVKAKSVSQSLGYYDNETNYCNMWNAFNTVKGFDKATVTTSDCKWVP